MNATNNDAHAASMVKMKNANRCFSPITFLGTGSSITKVEIAKKIGKRHASHIDHPCITKGLPCLDGIDNEPVNTPYKP